MTEGELTRREALKRLGLLGLSATAAGAIPGAFANDNREATALERVATKDPRALDLASRSVPKPPPDIVNGQGAWRMIDWGNLYEAFVDVPLWKSRGWGGFAVGYDYLIGYGGAQDFAPSSQLENRNPIYEVQRWIEGEGPPGTGFVQRCHANGCEAYIGTHFWNANLGSELPPWGDWFDTNVRADVAAKFGRLASFCEWIGMDGLKADTEGGLWGETTYAGNSHTAQETRDQAYSWGRAIGTATFEVHPSSKILIYNWHAPGGWEDTFIYGQTSASMPLTYFWKGYLEAMANHGNADARMVVTDAFFYKPLAQVAGASLANALKYHTQGSMAWLSRNLAPGVWNKVCDRIDMSLFSWAGTAKGAKFYEHTGEPAFADQLSLFRRYAMGTRRANYTYEGSPDRYCWIDHTHPAKEEPAGGFDQANNWYVVRKTSGPNDAPGGHLPGIRAAARRKPIDTTPPTLNAKPPVNNGDGTFTVSGSAHHLNGIRCVRGYIHPNAGARGGAQMRFNPQGGTYYTNYDAATQDYTITVTAKSGQYLMLTAVSIHDQEHSLRIHL